MHVVVQRKNFEVRNACHAKSMVVSGLQLNEITKKPAKNHQKSMIIGFKRFQQSKTFDYIGKS